MPKFEIGNEVQRLRHRDVTVGFEPSRRVSPALLMIDKMSSQHKSQRSPWLNIAVNELGQHVQADLVIYLVSILVTSKGNRLDSTGDCLDNTNRDREEEGDPYGQ